MHNNIVIDYKRDSFEIDLNEFWYFRRLIEYVKYFYSKTNNFNKTILLKIPGSGEFIKINKDDFLRIHESVENKIDIYNNKFSE